MISIKHPNDKDLLREVAKTTEKLIWVLDRLGITTESGYIIKTVPAVFDGVNLDNLVELHYDRLKKLHGGNIEKLRDNT